MADIQNTLSLVLQARDEASTVFRQVGDQMATLARETSHLQEQMAREGVPVGSVEALRTVVQAQTAAVKDGVAARLAALRQEEQETISLYKAESEAARGASIQQRDQAIESLNKVFDERRNRLHTDTTLHASWRAELLRIEQQGEEEQLRLVQQGFARREALRREDLARNITNVKQYTAGEMGTTRAGGAVQLQLLGAGAETLRAADRAAADLEKQTAQEVVEAEKAAVQATKEAARAEAQALAEEADRAKTLARASANFRAQMAREAAEAQKQAARDETQALREAATEAKTLARAAADVQKQMAREESAALAEEAERKINLARASTRLQKQMAQEVAEAERETAKATKEATRALEEQEAVARRAATRPGTFGEGGPLDRQFGGRGFEIPGASFARQVVLWGGVYSGIRLATDAVQQYAAGLVSTNASYEEMRATLGTIFGSSGAGQQVLDWLDRQAEIMPSTRSEVRQIGVAFAAAGSNIQQMVPVAGQLTAAMHVQGGVMNTTRAIIDAQNNQWRMLRDQVHLTRADLQQFGARFDQHGDIIGGVKALDDALAKLVAARYPQAMADQMKTLPGIFSNFLDVMQDLQRHTGASLYKGVENFLAPIITAMGDTTGHGVSGTLTAFADTVGSGLGQALHEGLGLLTQWFDRLGGLQGVIVQVQRAWIEFTGAVRTAWSIVQGVGDALGQVWHDLGDVAGILGTMLSPIKAVFDAFGAGGSTLREITKIVVTLGVELKLLATAYDLVKGVAQRFTGFMSGEGAALMENTAAINANTAALEGRAAAESIAGGRGGMLGVPPVPGGIGPVLPASMVSETTVAAEGFLSTFGRMGGAFYAAVGPMAAFLADMYLVPKAIDDIGLFVQTLRGIDVKGLQTDLRLSIPAGPQPYVSSVGPPGHAPVRALQTSGSGAFASYLQSTQGSEAYRDWAEFVQHQRPGDFISYVQRLPQDQMEQVALEYARQHGAGGQRTIESIATGTAPGLRPEQASNVYTLFNQAVARTTQDALSKFGRQQLPSDVSAQVEAYGARVRAQQPGLSDQRIGALIDQYARQTYGTFGLPLPSTFPTQTRAGKARQTAEEIAAAVTSTQQQVQLDEVLQKPFRVFKDDLDRATKAMTQAGDPADVVAAFYKQHMQGWKRAASQQAQQQLQVDETLKVPYAQLKHDLDKAAQTMRDAGDPADVVKAFYKQHLDAWARAQAEQVQNQLSADLALQKPYAQITADFDQLASALAAEGDNAPQLAVKLQSAIDSYFSQYISQIDSQRQALQALNAPVAQQLALVSEHQQTMQRENAALVARGLKPKFTPEQIQAEGVTGQRQVLGPIQQQQVTSLTAGYQAALEGGQITRLSQIPGYVRPIMAAEAALPLQPGETGAEQQQRLHLEQLKLIRQGQETVARIAQDQYRYDLGRGASTMQLAQDQRNYLAVIAAESGTNSAQYKLAKQDFDKQNSDRILGQLRKQFEWDTGPGGDAKRAKADEMAFLKLYAHQPGITPLDVKLMQRQLEEQRTGNYTRPPEPRYMPYGGLGRQPGFGGVEVQFGGPQADPNARLIATLREQLAVAREQIKHLQALLQPAQITATNTGRIAGIYLPGYVPSPGPGHPAQTQPSVAAIRRGGAMFSY